MFNCQGAGWNPEEHKCKAYPECYKTTSGFLSPDDVEWEQKESTSKFRNSKLFAIYLHKTGDFHLMKASEKLNVTLQPSSFEIVTIVPVHGTSEKVEFAAVGLVNMFNSGGAVQCLEQKMEGENVGYSMKIKGAGKFLAYSSLKPVKVVLNDESIEFEWSSSNGVLKFEVAWNGGDLSDAQILISS